MTKNKRIEAVGIQVDSNMDADDFGQRISECVRQLNADLNIVNLVKVDLGDSYVSCESLQHFLKNLKDMFESVNANNCVFIPVGERMGIKDIQIEYVKVVTDKDNE